MLDVVVCCDPTENDGHCTRRFHAVHSHFDTVIAVAVVANMAVMAMYYNGMSATYNSTLEWLNYGFLAFFGVEMAAKHIALGVTRYWKSASNAFDGIIVLGSCVLVLLAHEFPSLSAAKQVCAVAYGCGLAPRRQSTDV